MAVRIFICHFLSESR